MLGSACPHVGGCGQRRRCKRLCSRPSVAHGGMCAMHRRESFSHRRRQRYSTRRCRHANRTVQSRDHCCIAARQVLREITAIFSLKMSADAAGPEREYVSYGAVCAECCMLRCMFSSAASCVLHLACNMVCAACCLGCAACCVHVAYSLQAACHQDGLFTGERGRWVSCIECESSRDGFIYSSLKTS